VIELRWAAGKGDATIETYDFRDYHRTIIAFHGTTVAEADRLVDGQPFKPSNKAYEWLGAGVYFWEYAPKQAWWWATEMRKYTQPAVIGAMIRLGNCLDLLDPANVRRLRGYHDDQLLKWSAAGVPIPRNVLSKKSMDCAILNWAYSESDMTETKVETSRGVFVPTKKAKRAWPGSWIYDEAHIQVCVREQKNILAVWHAHPDGRYGRGEAPSRERDRSSHP
jgi:hypothetical protein